MLCHTLEYVPLDVSSLQGLSGMDLLMIFMIIATPVFIVNMLRFSAMFISVLRRFLFHFSDLLMFM